MASQKVSQILIARGAPFTPEQIAQLTERQAWAWIYEHFPPKFAKGPRNPDGLPEIHFTGFSDADKKELIQLARQSFFVAAGVTLKLKYLVAGPNAGPSKLAKARSLNVNVITEDEFYLLLNTGEVSE